MQYSQPQDYEILHHYYGILSCVPYRLKKMEANKLNTCAAKYSNVATNYTFRNYQYQP